MLEHFSIQQRFRLLLWFSLACFTLCGLIVYRTLDEIRVNGPIYERIMQGQDLVADILPPPAYLIESYLLTLQMEASADPDRERALEQRLVALKANYLQRYAYWRQAGLDGELESKFLKQSHALALSFYEVALGDFTAAVRRGDRAGAARTLLLLSATYEQQRRVIDQVVELARQRNADDEVAARERIRMMAWMLALVFALIVAVFVVIFNTVRRSIANPIIDALAITRRIAGGDWHQQRPAPAARGEPAPPAKPARPAAAADFADAADAAAPGSATADFTADAAAHRAEPPAQPARQRAERRQSGASRDEAARLVEAIRDIVRNTQTEIVKSEKMAALGSLVAGVSHELNTPVGNGLMAVSTLSDDLQRFRGKMRDGIKRSTLDEFLQSVELGADIAMRNLQRAAELMSSFKQVAADRASSQRRCFLLDQVVYETQMTLQPLLKRSHCQIVQEIPAGIEFDSFPGPLGQVLSNMVENAAKHGCDGQGGVITISARRLGADAVRISVADNGGGIAAELQSQVFDPFFTTRLGQGGSGLGLHIAHNIVYQVLGGSIALSSPPGAGARFDITLPLAAPRDVEEDASTALASV